MASRKLPIASKSCAQGNEMVVWTFVVNFASFSPEVSISGLPSQKSASMLRRRLHETCSWSRQPCSTKSKKEGPRYVCYFHWVSGRAKPSQKQERSSKNQKVLTLENPNGDRRRPEIPKIRWAKCFQKTIEAHPKKLKQKKEDPKTHPIKALWLQRR